MPIEIVVLPADERSPAIRILGISSISVIFPLLPTDSV
jgi:hypothetical protein